MSTEEKNKRLYHLVFQLVISVASFMQQHKLKNPGVVILNRG
jgi:hypothetical protein